MKKCMKIGRLLPVLGFVFACSSSGSDAEQSDDIVNAATAKPITDTHVHFWDISRPIPWPTPEFVNLYRTILPAEYLQVAQANGITGTNIVEASNVPDDNRWILDITSSNSDFFFSFAASLEVGSPTFRSDLDALAQNPRVVGIRGFLWSPELTVDAQQVADCRALADRGMTLDIISRGTLNPKAKVAELAAAVPNLRIIIDHLGGAKWVDPDPGWVADIQLLASHPNIYMKFSSFFDMFNPNSGEEQPWVSPTDLSAYKPHFDVLMKTLGPDRLIFGSNWPVVQQGGTIELEIALAEKYLAPFGTRIRNKVMHSNARQFYERRP